MASLELQVSELKDMSFSKLPLARQVEIKNFGRPRPPLKLTQVLKSKHREFKREFKNDLYEKNDWICGCKVTNKLFCFPCLLFSRHKHDTNWSKIGVKDLAHLSLKMKKHESTLWHLNATLKLAMVGKPCIREQLGRDYRLRSELSNKLVVTNLCELAQMIDLVKSFCFEFIAPGDADSSCDPNPDEPSKRSDNIVTEFDHFMKNHFANSSNYKSEEKHNCLLKSIFEVCLEQIKKEISEANSVSLIIEEIFTGPDRVTFIVLLTYVLTSGSPVERFCGFVRPSSCDAEGIADCISKTVRSMIDDDSKLISQSFDGVLINSRRLGVQAILQHEFKNAYYIHSYAHPLEAIVIHTASRVQPASIFFSNINSIIDFFRSDSPLRCAVLDDTLAEKVQRIIIKKLSVAYAIVTLSTYSKQLVKAVKAISTMSNDETETRLAIKIKAFLSDNDFLFYLTIFCNIMPHVSVLNTKLLNMKNMEVSTIRKLVDAFIQSIEKEKEKVAQIALNFGDISSDSEPQVKKVKMETDRAECGKLVCDAIIDDMRARFSFTSYYSCYSLFEPERLGTFDKNFPDSLFSTAVATFPFLDQERLKTELRLLYQSSEFRGISCFADLLSILIENDLHHIFSECFKLLSLVVTIPMLVREPDRRISTLERIKPLFKCTTVHHEKLQTLVMLAVEKDMVRKVLDFNERALNICTAKQQPIKIE